MFNFGMLAFSFCRRPHLPKRTSRALRIQLDVFHFWKTTANKPDNELNLFEAFKCCCILKLTASSVRLEHGVKSRKNA